MPRKKKAAECSVPQMAYNPDLDSYVLGSLKKCFLCAKFHNTKFLVGTEGTEFQCNDTLLGVISPVFREMLFEGKRSTGKIVLPNISHPGFAAIVRHAFSLDPEINPGNVIQVINACKVYKVYCLYKLAVKYVDDVLEAAAAFSEMAKYNAVTKFLTEATKFNLPEVVASCFRALTTGGVSQFLRSKAFTEFSAPTVKLVLGFDELACEEEEVWECALSWAKVQGKRNKTQLVDELRKIYHAVRFPLMSTKYFSSKVVPVSVLTKQEMLDLYCYLTYPEGKPSTAPFSSKPRIIWNNVQVMRFGGKVAGGEMEQDGDSHCIAVSVDRKCALTAVGTFCGEGMTTIQVNIYEGDDDDDRELLCSTDELKISCDDTEEPVRLELPEAVHFVPGTHYEIEIDQTGPNSCKIKDGMAESTFEQNGTAINFTWSKSTMDTQDTVKKGTIPCVWVNMLSGTGRGNAED